MELKGAAASARDAVAGTSGAGWPECRGVAYALRSEAEYVFQSARHFTRAVHTYSLARARCNPDLVFPAEAQHTSVFRNFSEQLKPLVGCVAWCALCFWCPWWRRRHHFMQPLQFGRDGAE